MGAVAAQTQQAVQLRRLVGLFHGGDFINVVVLHHTHQLEGGALGAQNGAAQGQDAAEVVFVHLAVVAVDQAAVTVGNAHDLHVISHTGVQCFCNAADGGVQARAITAGSQDTNTFFHSNTLFHYHSGKAERSGKGCRADRDPTFL